MSVKGKVSHLQRQQIKVDHGLLYGRQTSSVTAPACSKRKHCSTACPGFWRQSTRSIFQISANFILHYLKAEKQLNQVQLSAVKRYQGQDAVQENFINKYFYFLEKKTNCILNGLQISFEPDLKTSQLPVMEDIYIFKLQRQIMLTL